MTGGYDPGPPADAVALAEAVVALLREHDYPARLDGKSHEWKAAIVFEQPEVYGRQFVVDTEAGDMAWYAQVVEPGGAPEEVASSLDGLGFDADPRQVFDAIEFHLTRALATRRYAEMLAQSGELLPPPKARD